ncbi:MAG: hypothetical protein PHY02_01625 [Phycisphaerae bacterium]|nr:hypothetical protein [Phycisphaerae bacterium]
MKFKTILACIVKILNSLNVLKREHKNKSEKIFEQYLNSNRFRGKWIYELPVAGKSRKLDYSLDYNGQKCFFEVKELRKKGNEPTKRPAWIDPYTGLRDEINEARKQCKQFKDYSCSLVVFNIDDRQARLDPQTVLGAMLGNLGISMDINVAEGKAVEGTERTVFLSGGKMIDAKRKQPQNTTISAIVVLEEFLDNVEIERAFREEERRQGRKFTATEAWQNREDLQKKYSVNSVPRVVVIENPFARKPLPEGLFVGPFDERWRWVKEGGEVEKVFVGNKLEELEELKNKE